MEFKLNRNFALLYGVMLGDGCLSLVYGKKKYIAIAGSMADDVPFFNEIVKPIIKIMIKKDIPIKYNPNKGVIYLNFIKNDLFDFIHSFGFPIGKKLNQLYISKIFYEKNLVKYVIRGFFATDGSLVLTDNNGTLYPRVEANGIAKDLIKEISDFLNSKGVNCKFYMAKRVTITPNAYLHKHQQYRLQINGKENLKKFEKFIGFVNPKQIEKLKNFYGAREI